MTAPAPASKDSFTQDEPRWVDADGGYQLALVGKKLLCKNAKGKELTSVPKKVRESDVGQQLLGLRAWLVDHRLQCRSEVDQWMLRSLPVPSGIITKAWPDPAWRVLFENAVVSSTDDKDVCGFLKAVDEKRESASSTSTVRRNGSKMNACLLFTPLCSMI